MIDTLLSLTVLSVAIPSLIFMGIGVLALADSDDFTIAKVCFVGVGLLLTAKFMQLWVRHGSWASYPVLALGVVGCLLFCLEASRYVDRKRVARIQRETDAAKDIQHSTSEPQEVEKANAAPATANTRWQPMTAPEGQYPSLFDMPPKEFPFYPPGWQVPQTITCYICTYGGYPNTMLVVFLPYLSDPRAMTACGIYAVEHFAEIVAAILDEARGDKGRDMALRAQAIDPQWIVLIHGSSPLTAKGFSEILGAAQSRGLNIWKRHGRLDHRTDI